MKRNIIFILMLNLAYISTQAQYKKVSQKDVKALYKMMQGQFNSLEQSKADSSYYNILLKMKPMWTNKQGEYWLYVEQAMENSVDTPYRQRVYQLQMLNDSTITSTVYTIKNGEKYYGDWKKQKPLENLTTTDLEVRKGCLIYIHKTKKNKYKGATNASDCESSLRGASYATTEVQMSKKKVLSWDRGYDKEGKQVWGAVKGGYQFKKYAKW
jgi:CpeT protein